MVSPRVVLFLVTSQFRTEEDATKSRNHASCDFNCSSCSEYCEYHTVAHLFGVVRSTVCTIVHSTCQDIVNSLLSKISKLEML